MTTSSIYDTGEFNAKTSHMSGIGGATPASMAFADHIRTAIGATDRGHVAALYTQQPQGRAR